MLETASRPAGLDFIGNGVIARCQLNWSKVPS